MDQQAKDEAPRDTTQLPSAVMDMDCRGGNHSGCVGPPGTVCGCRCHDAQSASPTATLTSTPAPRQGDPAED